LLKALIALPKMDDLIVALDLGHDQTCSLLGGQRITPEKLSAIIAQREYIQQAFEVMKILLKVPPRKGGVMNGSTSPFI